METISDERIKVICNLCDLPMVHESTGDNKNLIFICEKCKYEVKVISICNKGVSQ